MTKDNIEKLKSNQVLEMIRVAHEFNVFTEDIAKRDYKEILSFFEKILPLLYLKGSLMPDIEVSDESYNERYVAVEHWENVFMTTKEKFSKDDEFWFLDDNKDTIKASVAEAIADIYQDTKDFVVLFQKNQIVAKENAVFEFKKLYAVHWGYRIMKILPQLHKIIYNKEIFEYEDL